MSVVTDKMKKIISGLEERKQQDRIHALLSLAADQPVQSTECPDAELLAAMIDGAADSAQREELLSHLASCPDCYETWLSLASPEQAGQGTGTLIKGPWYSRIGRSLSANKAAAAALAAAACLVLVVGTRFVAEKVQPSPAPAIFFQQADITRRDSFVQGYRQVAVAGHQKTVGQTRSTSLRKAASAKAVQATGMSDFMAETTLRSVRGQVQPNYDAASRQATVPSIDLDESFGIWLGKFTRECRQGGDEVIITVRTQIELEHFKTAFVQHNSAWGQSAGNFLLHLEALLTEPGTTVQCARLVSFIDDFVQSCSKPSERKAPGPESHF